MYCFYIKINDEYCFDLKNKMSLDFRKPLPQIFNTSTKKMNQFLNPSEINQKTLYTEKKNPDIRSQLGIK